MVRSLVHRHAARRHRLRAAGRAHRPAPDRAARRGPPARRPGQRGARAPPRPRPARAARRRRPAGGQRLQGDPGPPAAAAATTGGAAEVLLLEALDDERRTWEALVRPARKLRVGEVLLAGDEPVVEIGGRTEAGDTFTVTVLGDDDPLATLDRLGRMPLPPYITAPLGRAGPLPDRLRRRARLGRGADRRPAPHRRRCSIALAAGRRAGPRRAARRAGHVQAGERRRPARARDPQRALPRARRRAGAGAGGAAGRRRRHHQRARPRIARRHRRSSSGRTRLFIHRPYDWRVVDVMMTNFHLPRTTLLLMIDAFVGERWRRLYDDALADDYRFLSFGDAMLLDRTGGLMHPVRFETAATDGAARTGVATTARGSVPHAVLHAGRHPRGDQVPQRRRLRRPRRRDRARQHLPPDAAARAPMWSPTSAGSAASPAWDGLTLTDSGGFQVFSLEPEGRRRRRHVRQHLRRVQAPLHAGVGGGRAAAARRRHPDGARRLPAAAVASDHVIRRAVERTSAWAARARAAHRRDDQALFGIVQGGVDEALRGRAPSAPSALGLRRLRHRRAQRGGDPGGDAAGAGRGDRAPPGRPAALPDGRRRPGEPGRGRRPRGRPVRLRDADPPRPPRHGADVGRQGAREERRRTGSTTARSTRRAAARCAPATAAATCATCSRSASRRRCACVSLHNIAWTLQLMAEMRAAIAAGTFTEFMHAGARRLGLIGELGSIAGQRAPSAPSIVEGSQLHARPLDRRAQTAAAAVHHLVPLPAAAHRGAPTS